MTDVFQLSFLKQRNVEQYFAASIFIRPISTVTQCGWLMPEDLTHEGIRDYWRLVKERIVPGMDEDKASDASVQAAFEAGVHIEVLRWAQDLPFLDVPQAYASEIMRRQYLIRIGGLTQKLAVAIGAQDDIEVGKIIAEMSDQRRKDNNVLPSAYDIATLFEGVVNGGKRSIDTFIPPIDTTIGGLERQTLSIIAARPSMGKTALAWQIARNVAHSGSTALFFSLEMSAASLWSRAACPTVGTTWRDLRAGKVSNAKKTDLLNESYILAGSFGDHLYVIDSPQTTDSIWRMCIQHRPDLVVVDHLRLLKDKHDSEVKRLGLITERLKDIAKATNTAVLLAVQLSRAPESRSGNRPMLSDMRDSGEIEENADLVMMLFRESYYASQTRPPVKSLTECWIRKFRDGPSGVLINLMFDTEREWFESKDAPPIRETTQ